MGMQWESMAPVSSVLRSSLSALPSLPRLFGGHRDKVTQLLIFQRNVHIDFLYSPSVIHMHIRFTPRKIRVIKITDSN